MKIEYYKEHSTFLKRDMEFKIYGHAGKVFFVLPTQNNHFHEWEYRKMYDQVIDFIDNGECRFVSCEGIDLETWSNDNGGYPFRIDRHEEWIQYIIHELIPSARAKMGLGPDARFLATGASLGASHAANLFFRYPDVFRRRLLLFHNMRDNAERRHGPPWYRYRRWSRYPRVYPPFPFSGTHK